MMTFEQAIEVLGEVEDKNGLRGLLETLQFCDIPENREELTGEELRAFRVVFNEMRKLFVS